MSLIIRKNDFNDMSVDLKVLLENVKSTLDSVMGDFTSSIIVVHNSNDYFPMVYFSKDVQGSFIVNLGIYNNEWDRYSYQFAHEYCHIRTNYRSGNEKYSWFEESICEVSSHYTLKKMNKTWEKNSPCPNWKGYRKSLLDYSNKNFKNKPLSKESFKVFIDEKLPILKYGESKNHRDDYKVIAKKIIPFFDEFPDLWIAMTYWNKWELEQNDEIYEAFEKWLSILPFELKDVAKKIINQFPLKK
jgi:hypothetical protein